MVNYDIEMILDEVNDTFFNVTLEFTEEGLEDAWAAYVEYAATYGDNQ